MNIRSALLFGVCVTALLFASASNTQELVEEAISAQAASQQASAEVQDRIDRLDDETRGMLNEYRQTMSQVSELDAYNLQLERLVATQNVELADYERQFQEIETTKRQILPMIIRMLDVLVGNVGKPGGFCLSSLRGWAGRYGQEGLPKLSQPGPKPSDPKPWGTGEGYNEVAFKKLPQEVQDRVSNFPEEWKKKYFGELATPSEYPLAWHWYQMRVGQLVYPYIKEKRQKVSVYMSFTLGASYGYPEANVVREVLKDEELIPFHVAIDIGYGEQSALADIILPEATSLERWDHHSTNNYGLVPYTGVRQPLVEPAGETKSVQIILRDLARRIGGGMETYFDFEDEESYYKEWYKILPIPWEDFKKRGIWWDTEREKDYELY